jgi:hypothetical protein
VALHVGRLAGSLSRVHSCIKRLPSRLEGCRSALFGPGGSAFLPFFFRGGGVGGVGVVWSGLRTDEPVAVLLGAGVLGALPA